MMLTRSSATPATMNHRRDGEAWVSSQAFDEIPPSDRATFSSPELEHDPEMTLTI